MISSTSASADSTISAGIGPESKMVRSASSASLLCARSLKISFMVRGWGSMMILGLLMSAIRGSGTNIVPKLLSRFRIVTG